MSKPAAELDEMTALLRGLRPELDELARARVQARLSEAIGAAAVAPAPARLRPSRVLWPIGAAALIAAAAALVVSVRAPAPAPQRAPLAVHPPVVAVSPPSALVPPGPARLELAPHALAGAAAAGLVPRLGQPSDQFELPEGAVARAAIGQHMRLSLRGPARLRALALTSDRIELALDRGELAVEYDAGKGGELVIHTPHARVRVVGTLFGVRVGGGHTSVGVAHGAVQVDAGAERHLLHADHAWRSKPGTIGALDRDMRRALQAHAESVRPPAATHGVLSVEGSRSGVTARLGAQLLGETPVWALVQVGAVEVSLTEPGGGTSIVRTQVAGLERAAGAARDSVGSRTQPVPRRAAAVNGPADRTAPPPDTAALLYARAEQCLAGGDRDCARRELEALVARFAESAEAEPALYELGQMAADCAAAVPWLERYLRQHRNGRFAAGARQRLALCHAAR